MMLHLNGAEAKSQLISISTEIDHKAIQPNAVDLRLKKVFDIRCTEFVLSEDEKVHRETIEYVPKDGWWTLFPGRYEIILGDTISIAEGEAGFVITRSTLNRNGVFITSGLYDSKYVGPMAACMHVTTDIFKVKYDTRVAQFLLFQAEMLHPYDGSYGYNADGSEKEGQKGRPY